MIAPTLYVEAGILTAFFVIVAALAVRWPIPRAVTAAVGSFAAIVAWRASANVLGLNGDFLPAVSVGDTGCLLAGALAPFVTIRTITGKGSRFAPVLVGGLAGFIVNVVIL